MPSITRENLVDLFKNRPSLGAEMHEILGVPCPPYTTARLASIDLRRMGYFGPGPDVVVLLLDHDKPVRGVIVDVPSEVDPEKRFSWPVYVAGSFLLQECPTELLVVALEPALADWCAEPIEIGPPGFVLYPRVLSRTNVPVVTDPQEAARRPELGVLSAIAHGETKQGPKIAAAVLPALQGLEADRARLYSDLVINSLNEDARHDLQPRTSR